MQMRVYVGKEMNDEGESDRREKGGQWCRGHNNKRGLLLMV